jgi:hypothetical protein
MNPEIEQIAKEVLTCIRLLDFRLGLLINFGEALMKQSITP